MEGTEKTKVIAICGRPRVGKSFLVSLFAEDSYLYRSGCSKGGSDFTRCKVENIICEGEDNPRAEFHYIGEDDKDTTEKMCQLTQEEFPQFMKEINEYIKEKRKEEKDVRNENSIVNNTYLKIYMRPSGMAKEIMERCNLKTLIVTDTPGVAENYKLVPIATADLVMIVLGDANESEAKESYEVLVKELAPLVATGNVCFLYRMCRACESQEEYEECQKAAQEATSSFSQSFTDWKTSIVQSSLDVLCPEENVLAIPAMKPDKSCKAEEIFVSHYKDKIIEELLNETNNFDFVKEVIVEKGIAEEQVVELVKKVLNDCQYNEKEDIKEEFCLEQFKAEKHDRVKTKDDCRINNRVLLTRKNRLEAIFEIFKRYSLDEYDKEWQQYVIRYIYHMLTTYIKNDFGIGAGVHPAEASPEITMLAIESILAEEMLDKVVYNKDLNDKDNFQRNTAYQNVMKKWGVDSASWDSAIVPRHIAEKFKAAVIKLELIKKHLSSIKVESETDLVECRYIMGLQKLGEYYIWKDLSKIHRQTEEEIDNYASNYAREKMGIS